MIPTSENQKNDVVQKLKDLEIMNSDDLVEKLKRGLIYEVIRENTSYYAPYLIDNFEIIHELEKLSASVIGLNGAGPSLFALCNPKNVTQFISEVKNSFDNFELIHTRVRKFSGDFYSRN